MARPMYALDRVKLSTDLSLVDLHGRRPKSFAKPSSLIWGRRSLSLPEVKTFVYVKWKLVWRRVLSVSSPIHGLKGAGSFRKFFWLIMLFCGVEGRG
jgi:hypothetical protein